MKFIVVGGSNMDIIGCSYMPLVLKDSNPGEIHFSLGGVGRNICENIQKLGIQTVLITVLGNDPNGFRILDEMKAIGTDVSNVSIRNDYGTSCYLSINNSNGDMEIALSGMEILDTLNVEYLKSLDSIILSGDGLVLDTNLPQESISYLLTNYGDKIPCYVDGVSVAKVGKLVGLLDKIRLLKVNRYEAKLLGGTSDPREASVELQKLGVKIPVVTMGSEGAYYGINGEIHFVEAVDATVVNAGGAGDSFMAGIVAAIGSGESIETAMYLGSAAAALTISSSQTVSPEMSMPVIRKLLDEHNKSNKH